MRSSSSFTPKLLAYSGSSACSASIKAQIPPFFCASAIAWRVRVVLPDDSGPNTSIILPLGYPPTPSASSRPRDPDGIASTLVFGLSPSFIMASSPNFVLISFSVSSIELSAVIAFVVFFFAISLLLHIHSNNSIKKF